MITVQKYIEGIESIYVEQPSYALNHDGSDGKCDCIGMVKGAIRRGGGDATGLSGVNYAARYTIRNLQKIAGSAQLQVGQVVLKKREPGESGYNLPDKYRPGGKNDTGDYRDYYHIGTVTRVYPLEITHMTSPKPKKDTSIGKWAFFGDLPQVAGDYTPVPEPEPVDPFEPVIDPGMPTLRRGDKGEYVTLLQTRLIQMGYSLPKWGADGDFGSETMAAVIQFQQDWNQQHPTDPMPVDGVVGARTWDAILGGMMTTYTVTIRGVSFSVADEIVKKYGGTMTAEGVG